MGSMFIQADPSLRLYRALDQDMRARGFAPSHVASLAAATDHVERDDVSSLRRHGLGPLVDQGVLRLLIPATPGHRRAGNGVRTQVWGGSLASGSFLTCGDGIYISSPEFVFLQMAARTDAVSLTMLGMELCGCYRMQDKHVAYQMPRLTNVRRIRSFLSRMVGTPGTRRAREALAHVMDGLESPAQTALLMQLCLPTRMGGYALPMPRLEQSVRLSNDLEGPSLSLLCWSGISLAVSECPGIGGGDGHPVVVTPQTLCSDELLRSVALLIAANLGISIRQETRTFRAARDALRVHIQRGCETYGEEGAMAS